MEIMSSSAAPGGPFECTRASAEAVHDLVGMMALAVEMEQGMGGDRHLEKFLGLL